MGERKSAVLRDLTVFLDRFGPMRLETLFLNGHKDLIGKVDNLKFENCECPNCSNKTLLLAKYRLISTGEEAERFVHERCNGCETIIEAIKVTQDLQQKRKDATIGKWYAPTYSDVGFKTYNPYSKCTRVALEISRAYTQKIINGETRNLLMMGSTGTGKSFLSSAIARTLHHKELSAGYITAVELFKRIRDTFGKPGAEKRLFDEIRAIQTLVIDDVGVETVKIQDDVSWTHSKWVELIELRRGLSTVYTTNFDETKIYKVIGERATSRLYENCDHINLFTDDYRKMQHAT